MKISFNPIVKTQYSNSFKSLNHAANNSSVSNTKLSKEEIATNKIKKTISELKYIILGVGIIYFAMKKNIKNNGIKAMNKKAEELANLKVLDKILNKEIIDTKKFLSI